MSVFAHYARYYDLLYRDKDYAAEAAFVHGLIQQHAPGSRAVLELGCGTGRHAVELARLGYTVDGIDLSAEMVSRAQALYAAQGPELAARLTAAEGDIRSHRQPGRFDAVLSLFHVVNYQTRQEDLLAAMATAAAHVRPGGIFGFDFWYGPAVLADPPRVRVRRLEDDVIAVTRIAEPESRPNENRVEVNYHIFVREKATGACTEVRETHAMRYLFLPEMQQLLDHAGFTPLASGAWPSREKPLGLDTWYGWMVARRR
jgi:SAM-dependent methyltransferase